MKEPTSSPQYAGQPGCLGPYITPEDTNLYIYTAMSGSALKSVLLTSAWLYKKGGCSDSNGNLSVCRPQSYQMWCMTIVTVCLGHLSPTQGPGIPYHNSIPAFRDPSCVPDLSFPCILRLPGHYMICFPHVQVMHLAEEISPGTSRRHLFGQPIHHLVSYSNCITLPLWKLR